MINLLHPATVRQYLARPARLLEVVRAQPSGQTIIIDEIQKVPELLSLVHLLIEEKKGWHFMLTGSSARKLKRAGMDLLGGRALNRTLHPFMAVELAERFDFDEALQFGLLPLRFASAAPAETLAAYVSLYLNEEVKSEGMVRHIAPFAKFLEVLSFAHGSTLNLSNLARESAIKRSTASLWLAVVEDLVGDFPRACFSQVLKATANTTAKALFF